MQLGEMIKHLTRTSSSFCHSSVPAKSLVQTSVCVLNKATAQSHVHTKACVLTVDEAQSTLREWAVLH